MPDDLFEHPRLAAIYDALDPDRSDLEPYRAMVRAFGARRVVDLGCGTGVLALLIAGEGPVVTGVDPAGASLDVARAKPGASAVTWRHGDATAIPPSSADLVLMTGNAAQAIVEDDDWLNTLRQVRAGLRPGGRFVFETRRPEARGWERWTDELSRSTTEVDGVGAVTSWVDLTDVSLPLVSFRWTFVFRADGQVLTSDSTLRFRDETDLRRGLRECGFEIDDVRDAPDRPGRELVVVARKGPRDAQHRAE
jgi:SAM-dependent methyltransferase